MKNRNVVLKTIIFLVVGLIMNLFLSWYAFGLGFAFLAFILERTKKPFWFGFLMGFVLWFGMALFINNYRLPILTQKIAEILPLGGSDFLLIFVTGVLSGIFGGLWTITGTYLNSYNK